MDIPTTGSVNTFSPKYLMYLDPVHGPCVRNNSSQSTVKLPDTSFGRWFLRTHFPSMHFTPEGHAWYAAQDPAKFEISPYLINPPTPYQMLGFTRMDISNCALWWDMGLGKTYLALGYSLYRHTRRLGNLSLVICPLSVFVTWQDQIAEHVSPASGLKCFVCYGRKRKEILLKARLNSDSGMPTFVVTNYESVTSLLAEFSKLNVSIIYVDESSRIKNPDAIRTQEIHKLRALFPNSRRFVFSGTPSTKTPLGYYSQFEFLGDKFSGCDSYFIFKQRYCNKGIFMKVKLPNGNVAHVRADTEFDKDNWLGENYPPGVDNSYKDVGYFFTKNQSNPSPLALKIINYYPRIFGYKNLDQLHLVHQQHGYALMKTDVLKDLPPKTYSTRRLVMPKEQRDTYANIRSKYKVQIESTVFSFSDRSSPFAKLHTLANGFIYDENHNPIWLKSQPKLDELAHIIDEIGENQKVVVWSAYPAQILQIQKFLKDKLSIKSAVIYGATPAEKRPDIIHEFWNQTDWIIANPEVAGLGLNLTCSYLEIFMSTWCKSDTRAQAEARLHRKGQTHPVLVIDIIMQGTVEAAILRCAKNEIELENKLLRMTDLDETWEE
jgi:SNF2 family DNA or RNA helicase